MAMEYPQSLIQGQEGMRVGNEECIYLRKHETRGLKYAAISFPILKLLIHFSLAVLGLCCCVGFSLVS